MERVVNRSDLVASESSQPASPEPGIIERIKGLDELEYISRDQAPSVDGPEADEEIDFRLFAAPKSGANEVSQNRHKIRLRSPSIDPSKAGFVQPLRDEQYYFTGSSSDSRKQELETAALTGHEVIELSQISQPGSTYPWKILHISPSGLRKDILAPFPSGLSKFVDDTTTKKRTRPGKKYRIKLRKKFAAKQAATQARKANVEAKEAAEREKRTRRNREKKVKKKAKEKAKKGGEDAAGVGEVEGDAMPAD